MSFRAMIWAWEVDGLTTTTKMVLLALASHANDCGGSCYPSVKKVAAECRMSDRAVQNALKTLASEGYIRVDRNPQRPNNFQLLMRLKVEAGRVQEVHPVVQDVHQGGAGRSPEPVNEPVKERTPIIPGGSQSLLGIGVTPPTPNSQKPEPVNTATLVDAWNHICGAKGIPKVAAMTDARKSALLARYAELGGTEADWIKFCRRISKSPLLTGDNDRDWRAGFDWCLKPANFVKIIEGNYDPKGQSTGNREARFEASPGTI